MVSRSYLRQGAAVNLACIPSLLAGAWISWASVSLKKLMDTEPDLEHIGFRLNTYQMSWMICLLDLGNASSPILACIIMKKIGRKYSLLISGCFSCIPILFLFYQDVICLYIARFSVGFAKGIAMTTLSLYISEIAESRIRGTLVVFVTIYMYMGILSVLLIGPHIYLSTLSITLCILPFVFMFFFSFVPESPYYLASVMKLRDAKESLKWFRGSDNVDEEFTAIVRKSEADMKETGSFMELFRNPINRKAMFIVFVTSALNRLGGITSLIIYAPKTFPETNIPYLDPAHSSTILMLSIMAGGITQYRVADILGRKPFLALSSILDCIALVLIGIYFISPSSDYSYVVYILLILYGFCVTGVGAVPYILVGEMFPMNIRCEAAAFSTVSMAAGSTITNKFHLLLVSFANTSVVMFIYAFLNFLMFAFTMKFVFETKCKTFEEIQSILEKSVRKNERKRQKNGRSV
uniref:Facilitated trehalose transporter Tret1 n=1 Tax=Cacopsylla melanoneura TaxID=428564 RepID=A0A8D8ZVX5_9HEMI